MKLILTLLIPLQVYATSYKKDAKPIFENKCMLCHNDSMPDKNWMKYNIAVSKKDLILKRVWVLKDMPPGNVTVISYTEREILKNWIEEGCKE